MEQNPPSIKFERSETWPIGSYSSNLQKLAWWIEIHTVAPICIYYFGPFERLPEAKLSIGGYVQDLIDEGAKEIVVLIKKCKPDLLTIVQDVRE